MKKSSPYYSMIFGFLFIIIGFIDWYKNGTIEIGLFIFGVIPILISVLLLVKGEKTVTVIKSSKSEKILKNTNKSLFHTGEFVFGNTVSRTADEHKTQTSESVQKDEFFLGTFNFTEEDRQPLKNAALRYLPTALDTIEAQLSLLKTLSLVMEVSVVELKTEFSWKIPDAMPEEMKKERFTSALIETILSVNQTLGFLNPDFLIKKLILLALKNY